MLHEGGRKVLGDDMCCTVDPATLFIYTTLSISLPLDPIHIFVRLTYDVIAGGAVETNWRALSDIGFRGLSNMMTQSNIQQHRNHESLSCYCRTSIKSWCRCGTVVGERQRLVRVYHIGYQHSRPGRLSAFNISIIAI